MSAFQFIHETTLVSSLSFVDLYFAAFGYDQGVEGTTVSDICGLVFMVVLV
jgi:hypothetical protein